MRQIHTDYLVSVVNAGKEFQMGRGKTQRRAQGILDERRMQEDLQEEVATELFSQPDVLPLKGTNAGATQGQDSHQSLVGVNFFSSLVLSDPSLSHWFFKK